LTPEESILQNAVDPKDRRSVWRTRKYRQDHLPLAEQTEATGHAVRAGYMYAAMADAAGAGRGPGYGKALDRLWDDVVGKKLYLTGGVGTAQFGDEGFGTAYRLPNDKAYCETCAAVANILWNSRMNLLRGEAKYVDVLELALYNGFLSGVSRSGDEFFYQNPLASSGRARRESWSDPACCPSNVVRLIPQVGGFLYAQDDEGITVNLYVGSTAVIPRRSGPVKVVQTTRYPWEGKVGIRLDMDGPEEFTLRLRRPGWASEAPVPSDLYVFADAAPSGRVEPGLTVNGKPVESRGTQNGYLTIRRTWKSGDVVELDLPMPARRVQAHPAIEADRGRVALMRGPLVYCLEAADHPFDITAFELLASGPVKADQQALLLGGVTVLKGQGSAGEGKAVDFTAVPYYAWANRGPGPMLVWIPASTSGK
jgi:hypothetical protein